MSSNDRLKASLESLFQLMLPRLAYTMQWEGRVLLAVPPTPTPAFVAALYQGPATYTTPGYVNVQLTDPDALVVFGPAFSSIPIVLWGDASGFVCVPTIGRARTHVSSRMHARMRACVPACVHACTRACMHACARDKVH